MPEYVLALSDADYDILEEIFTEKYQKFVQLYWLICKYSDYITSLSYKETKKEVLKVDLTLAKLKVSKVLEDMNSEILDEKKVIHIEITKDESVA